MYNFLSTLFRPIQPFFFSEDKAGATTEPVAMNYYGNAQTEFKPPLIANENAFLGDVASSESLDSKSPISCGLYRLEKGTCPVPRARGEALCPSHANCCSLQAHHSCTNIHTTR